MSQLNYFLNSTQRQDGYFATTAAALGTTAYLSPDLGAVVVLMIASLAGGETVAVTGTHDGTNFEAALKPINTATGLPAASTALVAGTYILTQNYRKYKLTKSAAVQLGVAAYYQAATPLHGSLPVSLSAPQYVAT